MLTRGRREQTEPISNSPPHSSPVLRLSSGTGKTTVARSFAEVFSDLGLLSSSAVVECRGRDLMGGYVGQTAPLVTAKMEEALGGVLFIDEAYGLASGLFGR